MNGRIVFLLEEPSMKELLDRLLPRVFPGWIAGQHFLCVKHAGKSDLEKSIPRKLKAWQEPGVRFIIVRDNDNGDCLVLKRKLAGLCETGGRPDALVRIVCQELEAWYLGDLPALAAAFDRPTITNASTRKRFADPDSVFKPALTMAELFPRFQKISGARVMGERLSVENNRSRSFAVFVQGVQRIAIEMGYIE